MQQDAIGLVCAGGVSQSFLARMPALLQQLGPIKTSSYRVSRQISNSLRAGYAASHYNALEPCPLILVSAPEENLDRILREMAARIPIRKAPFTKNTVVLCGCTRDSLSPSALQGTGARVATVNPIPDTSEELFVGEGDTAAIRRMRTIFGENRRKLICLRAGTKPLYFAAIHAGAPLLLPWIATGMSSLRAAGFSRSEAATVGELLGTRALRRYAKGGAKSWSRRTESDLRRALDEGLEQIRARFPRLAERYEQGIRVALEEFSPIPRRPAGAEGLAAVGASASNSSLRRRA